LLPSLSFSPNISTHSAGVLLNSLLFNIQISISPFVSENPFSIEPYLYALESIFKIRIFEILNKNYLYLEFFVLLLIKIISY